MNTSAPLSAFAALWILAPFAGLAHAQHSDIRFSYVDERIVLSPTDGQPFADQSVWLAEWDTDGFFQQTTGQPGFGSEAIDGLGIGSGDVIAYHVLDPLTFWDGAAFAPPAAGVQVRIGNNLGPDTVVSGDSGTQPGSAVAPYANGVGDAFTSGDFHSHVEYSLEPNLSPAPAPPPALGAYGLKLSLTTDAPGVLDSAPFFIVFNFGLSAPEFETAVAQFAALLAPGVPGDFNRDGRVDAADYAVWRDGLGARYAAADYADWLAAYGGASTATGQTATPPTPTPEPATAALFAGGLALICTSGRRKERCP